jgi:hypothetical protein
LVHSSKHGQINKDNIVVQNHVPQKNISKNI